MQNIVLIGMPGSGKSTVGKRLAQALAMKFVDTDDIIIDEQNAPLQQIIAEKGVYAFMDIENDIICRFSAENTVIATGGSVVLYPEAMEHLAKNGKFVYLETTLPQLQKRIKNLTTRGIVFKEGQDLAAIYKERVPLYEKYADLTVNVEKKKLNECVHTIVNEL